jgi:hypothetical protein
VDEIRNLGDYRAAREQRSHADLPPDFLTGPLGARPGDIRCGYKDCKLRARHAAGPEIDLCDYHLIRASHEHEALVSSERVCLDHDYRFPAGTGCPVCSKGLSAEDLFGHQRKL